MAPKHLICHVICTVGEQKLQYKSLRIASGGVFSFGSGVDPDQFEVGKKVHLDLLPESGPKEILKFSGVLCREYNKDGLIWSAKFLKDQPDFAKIKKAMESFGVDPPYVRKNPRIPGRDELKYLPTLALVPYKPRNVTFHVANVSMGGCALWTEDPHGMLLKFDEIVGIEFQPRADFNAINFKGRVARVEHDVNLDTMNVVYRLGIHYQEFDEDNKALFVKMMQNIVEEIQAAS